MVGLVQKVEEAVGMAHCAWDCVDPSQLCQAVIDCWVKENIAAPGEMVLMPKPMACYIATYSAECDGGHVVTANLAMQSVLEGTTPGALIELITEQAFSDMARSGNNAVRVVVLNLSRVW